MPVRISKEKNNIIRLTDAHYTSVGKYDVQWIHKNSLVSMESDKSSDKLTHTRSHKLNITIESTGF